MQELINKIMQKAIEISKNTETKIVAEYSGLTESITIYSTTKLGGQSVKHLRTVYLDFENAEKQLEEILQKLESLEKMAEGRK